MNKKLYTAPSLEVAKLQPSDLIATSNSISLVFDPTQIEEEGIGD